MYYKKVETYSFSMPKEFNAYLKFKDNLKDMGTDFLDEGGAMSQTITVTTGGRIETSDGTWPL